jgi:NAD(P)-dependent dehydrogenase (short-subunit alcohol dehydrogenase family)
MMRSSGQRQAIATITGRLTPLLFWEEGAAVVLIDRDAAAASAAAAAIDPTAERAVAVAADLAVEDEAARAVGVALAAYGRLDVLANVAGIRVYGPVADATVASWQAVIDVNLLAVAYCSKFAVPPMVQTGRGSIINVSSANAIVGRAGMGQYDASKAAVLALTRTMACEHADQGIRVNAVCPGPVLTQFHVRRRAARDQVSLAAAEMAMRGEGASNLLRRMAEPREIAYAALFLASDEASYVTGATFMIDGGLSV